MDSIIAKQKLKQEIEDNNSFANMLEDMYYAFESYISEIKQGNRDTTLRIPPICQSSMKMLDVVDEYQFIDALCHGLSDYAFQSVYSGGLSKNRDMVVRSYNGNDVNFGTWLKEINDLVAKITNWRKDLNIRILTEKYK